MENLEDDQIRNTLFLDATTLDNAVAVNVAEQMEGLGASMLDCPVSGGVVGATNGTLAFMCGGNRDAYQKAEPFLQLMGSKIIYCGDHGHGISCKLTNNMLLGITMAATAEAFLLGTRLGLDPALLSSVINSSSGRSWSSEVNNPCAGATIGPTKPPSDREYAPGFMTKLMSKDLKLASEAAKGAGVDLTMGKIAEEIYSLLASNEDYATKDFSSIMLYLQRNHAK